MKYGLSEEQFNQIVEFISRYSAVEEAVLFGSRAIDTFKEASDVDIALKGEGVDESLAAKLKFDLEEDTYLPFFFDCIAYPTITNDALRQHINKKGIVIYRRGGEDVGEWCTVKFSDVLVDESISYGIVQPGSHTEINCVPIIRVNNIKYGHIKTDDVMKISADIEGRYQRTRLVGGELLITVVGSIGECAIVPKKLKGWNVARAVSVARIKDSYDKQFIKYCFKSEDIKFQMYGNTNDTVQPTLNLSSLKSLELQIPSLAKQKSIASILSSLDDKIDLLHRQNKTLEAMAETLFRQWFDNKECDGEISQLISIQNGYAFKSSDFKEIGEQGVLKIKNISDGVIDIQNTDFINASVSANTPERFNVTTGDVLIGMTGAEIGKLGIVPKINKSLWLNQRVGLLREKYPGAKYFAYIQLKSEFGQDYIENTATGSAQPNISGTGIEGCGFPSVDEETIRESCKQIAPFYKKLVFNLGQMQALEKLRDNLLPKLMSGEVRVGAAPCGRPINNDHDLLQLEQPQVGQPQGVAPTR